MNNAAPIRLLYWTEYFWPSIGGMETLAVNFIPTLRARCYEIAVVTNHQFDYPEVEIFDGTTIHRLPFHKVLRSRSPTDFIKLRRRVEAIRNDFAPHLIHINLQGPSIAMHLEANRRSPIPTIVAIHHDFSESGALGNLVRRTLDNADWVTAVSKATLRDIRSMFPQIKVKSSCIYNGLVTETIEPKPLSTDPPRVLCMGRLIREKGFDLAIDAFAQIGKRFPKATLAIAGDGPERSALEQQAQALGLSDSVNFTGWIKHDRIYDLLSESSIVLVPSRWREPFGLVAIEAALMARPVIAARTGGLGEVLVDGKTGYLVERENPDAMADRLANLLSQRELAVRLGRNARADVLRRFGIDANVAAYDALYRRILASYNASSDTAQMPSRADEGSLSN